MKPDDPDTMHGDVPMDKRLDTDDGGASDASEGGDDSDALEAARRDPGVYVEVTPDEPEEDDE